MKRVFIAVEVKNPALINKLIEIERSIEYLGVPIKMVEPENLHITLVFIGEVEEDIVEEIKSAISEVVSPPISAQLVGMGAFPTIHSPRVVWVGIKRGSQEIVQLQKKVESALREHRISFEKERNFVPHLTLGRVKGKRNIEKLASFIEKNADMVFGDEEFNEIKLKESILTPKGPIYKDLFIQKMLG
ncbi:MAG: RNA 2',3'-cyclic phosphodiesterase [Fervidicoccaceae archaeon]